MQVEQTYVILTPSEYAKLMGGALKAKDPKVHRVRICVNGSWEEVYCFKDHADPWRRLRVTHSLSEHMETSVMDTGSHLHCRQAEKIMAMISETRMEDAQLAKLPYPTGTSALPTIWEHQARIQEKKGEVESKPPATTMSAAGPSSMEVVDCDDETGEAPGDEEEENEEGDSKEVVAEMQVKQNKFPALVRSSSWRPSPSSSVKKAGSRAMSSSSLVAGEGESQADTATQVSAGAPKKKEPECPVEKWVGRLSLMEIVRGKKLGLQLHHAKEAKAKISLQSKQIALGGGEGHPSGDCRNANGRAPGAHLKSLSLLHLC